MKKIDNSIKITGMIIVAVFVVTLLVLGTFTASTERKMINTQGEATVTVMPDIVSINFAAETTEDTSKSSKDANVVITDAVIEALIAAGFEREEIETTNYNIYEDFQWKESGRESLGFKATHEISVEFGSDEYEEIGLLVDAGVDAGALLRSVRFSLSPELESEYKAEALKLAGADAKLKAKAMVSGVDGKLGKLVSVSESSFGYQPWLASGMMESSARDIEQTTSIQIGEREVQGRISVTYEIR